MREIKIGECYHHFKGGKYKVLYLAYDCETYQEDDPLQSRMVIYQDINNEKKIWVRKYSDFISLVDREKYPQVTQTYRFEKMEEC